MAKPLPDDILLPAGAAEQQRQASPFAAFIPISLAVAGVAAILLGGVTVQVTAVAEQVGVDPVVTGSIQKVPSLPTADVAHAR